MHNLIDFALLTPGGLATVVALGACACAAACRAQCGDRGTSSADAGLGAVGRTVSESQPATPPARTNPPEDGLARTDETPARADRRTRIASPARNAHAAFAGAAALVLLAAYVVAIARPTVAAERALRRFRAASFRADGPPNAAALMPLARQAANADRWDAGAPRYAAGVWMQLSGGTRAPAQRLDGLLCARGLAQTALARNERSSATHRLLGLIYEQLENTYLELARSEDFERALREGVLHWERAVELFPTDPRLRIGAARAWKRLWKETDAPQAAEAARIHFTAALTIDAQRAAGVAVKLRPEQVADVEREINELRAAAGG